MNKTLFNGLFSAVILAATVFAVTGHAAEVTMINGAGATFPYPVYAKWASAYQQKTGVKLNYQAIGSGGGIKQIQARTVDFGASDAPLKAEELKQAGLLQFPMIMGGVVPVIHLEGIAPGALKLDGETLAAIYLGEISKWNDERIKKLNPGLKLPDRAIVVVHRSDGSGTTFIFTNYLAKVSDAWKKKVGVAKAVSWPAGVGGKGNQGVASYVQRINGAIGYVEYAYALQLDMVYAQLRNKAGNYVAPSQETFSAAAAGADWAHAPGFHVILTNEPGAKSWPISGASFILVPKKPDHPDTLRAVLKFFDWCYREGGEMAMKLDYVPMPKSVVDLAEKAWREQIVSPDGQPIWVP